MLNLTTMIKISPRADYFEIERQRFLANVVEGKRERKDLYDYMRRRPGFGCQYILPIADEM